MLSQFKSKIFFRYQPGLSKGLFAALALFSSLSIKTRAAEPTEANKLLSPVTVEAGGHFLQTSDGKPFFWLGDTAWNLIHGTTRNEATYYLRTRAHQGYNVIQVVVLGETTNTSGSPTFIAPFVDQDPTKPNDAYFARMVEIVDEAAANGLYVALVPTWGDKMTAPMGEGPRIFRLDNLNAASSYGKYLATHLKGRTNILWMLGGDTFAKLDPSKPNEWPQDKAIAAGFPADYDWRPIWRAMAAGITDGFDRKPVFLFHPAGARSTSPDLHNEAWLAINGMQSGHERHDFPVWNWVERDFALVPAKPTLDLEPNYEDHPVNPWPRWDPAYGYFRDYDVRKQCYRSVFAGACGVTYGHHAVWGFAGERNDARNHVDRDWIDGMQRPGGREMIYLRELVESRPFFTRMPDPALVNNLSPAPSAHIEACRDRAGSYALIYFPESEQEATVDLSKLAPGKLVAWWYDPRTGFPHPLGEVEHGATAHFKTPAYGPDWVLVIDSEAAGYSAPGQIAIDAPALNSR